MARKRPSRETIRVESSDWGRFVEDPAFRQAVELRIGVTLELVQKHGPPALVGHVGSGVGLIGHLLACEGLAYIGVDADAAKVVFSRVSVQGRGYPGPAPRFEKQPDPPSLPLGDGAVRMLLLFDQLALADEAGAASTSGVTRLLLECERVLSPEGLLVLVERRPLVPPPSARAAATHFDRLLRAVGDAGGFEPIIHDCWNDPLRDAVLIARRCPVTPRRRRIVDAGDRIRATRVRPTVPTVRVEG